MWYAKNPERQKSCSKRLFTKIKFKNYSRVL